MPSDILQWLLTLMVMTIPLLSRIQWIGLVPIPNEQRFRIETPQWFFRDFLADHNEDTVWHLSRQSYSFMESRVLSMDIVSHYSRSFAPMEPNGRTISPKWKGRLIAGGVVRGMYQQVWTRASGFERIREPEPLSQTTGETVEIANKKR